jgi:hypothetical protein
MVCKIEVRGKKFSCPDVLGCGRLFEYFRSLISAYILLILSVLHFMISKHMPQKLSSKIPLILVIFGKASTKSALRRKKQAG